MMLTVVLLMLATLWGCASQPAPGATVETLRVQRLSRPLSSLAVVVEQRGIPNADIQAFCRALAEEMAVHGVNLQIQVLAGDHPDAELLSGLQLQRSDGLAILFLNQAWLEAGHLEAMDYDIEIFTREIEHALWTGRLTSAWGSDWDAEPEELRKAARALAAELKRHRLIP